MRGLGLQWAQATKKSNVLGVSSWSLGMQGAREGCWLPERSKSVTTEHLAAGIALAN